MKKRVRTALFCCLTLVDLGLVALVPVSTRWLNPASAGLKFTAPMQSVPSVNPTPDQNNDCDSGNVRSAWCETRYTRLI